MRTIPREASIAIIIVLSLTLVMSPMYPSLGATLQHLNVKIQIIGLHGDIEKAVATKEDVGFFEPD